MCENKKRCQKPENLKDKPENCSPDQINACHGEVKTHPCPPLSKARPQKGKN